MRMPRQKKAAPRKPRLPQPPSGGLVCRFCQSPFSGPESTPPPDRVCDCEECRAAHRSACRHLCPCGHACSGLKDERRHIGCALCSGQVCACGEPCWTAPSILLRCGHAAHMDCAFALYRVASDSGLLRRPKCGAIGCRALPEHPIIADQFEHWRQILAQVRPLLLRVIKDERIDREPQVNRAGNEYFRNPALFARDHCRFAMCDRCRNPYYAGRAACGEGEGEGEARRYRCQACEYANAHLCCEAHGDTAMVFKCFWCCRPAVFYCWGTTHFCGECHEQWQERRACEGRACEGNCQFGEHPPNGTHEKFGYCRLCRE